MTHTHPAASPAASRFLPAYASETVPRYTSYPPATKFHDGVGETDWRRWLTALPPSPALSIYVHIPFCRSMCWYCGCNTTVPNKDDRIARYLEALHREIATAGETAPSSARVGHIHFGGGSPDMLSPERFAGIMDALRSAFTLAPSAEVAVEMDPRGLTPELAEAMAECGVTRASLGVQDLSDEVQKLIHRIQPESVVRTAVGHLRAVGITGINMDIMYGLPAQTVARVESMAHAVADMDPDRVAVFGYAHVPWFKKHQKAIPEDRLPDAEARFDQMQATARVLVASGYDAIGFDHFAHPHDNLAIAASNGSLQRNFQGYTDDAYDALIGLGASAISDTGLGFVQNEVDPARYADAVLGSRPIIARGVARTVSDTPIAKRIERLMCQFEAPISPEQSDEQGDTSEPSKEREALLALQRDGLIELDGTILRVTDLGRPYVRNIAARLDPAFASSDSRHSSAV